jgi:hypothetical protein
MEMMRNFVYGGEVMGFFYLGGLDDFSRWMGEVEERVLVGIYSMLGGRNLV